SPIGTTAVFALTFRCTADAATGSYPTTLVTPVVPSAVLGSRISTAEFAPGSPAPTASWSVTLTDTLGLDLLAGNGASLSATATTGVTIGSIPITSTLTLAITGNSVNSAVVTIVVYIAPANYAFNQKGGGGAVGSLTTNGYSGPAALVGSSLNIPNYSSGNASDPRFQLVKTSATVLTLNPTLSNTNVANIAAAGGAGYTAYPFSQSSTLTQSSGSGTG